MKKQFAEFTGIEYNEPITEKNHSAFLNLLKRALLLALKEQGILQATQYLSAEEHLLRQAQERARILQQEGDGMYESCGLLPCFHGPRRSG